MHLTIDFPPQFVRRYGGERPPAFFIERIFNAKLPEQRAFLDVIRSYNDIFPQIELYAAEESPEPRWRQPWFHPLDGVSLYSMVASRKPETYFEIGSGNSTKFAARAVRDHDLKTRVVSIDPEPRAEIDQIADEVIRDRVENIGLSMIDKLSAGDIVLFDGSHRSLQNSDVTAFFIDILPMLKPGTVVGVHDVFWPLDYPEGWIPRFYNEQYVLGAYILGLGLRFPLLFSCAHMSEFCRGEVLGALRDDFVRSLTLEGEHIRGMTLWFEKPEVEF